MDSQLVGGTHKKLAEFCQLWHCNAQVRIAPASCLMLRKIADNMEASDKTQEAVLMLNENLSRIRKERGLTQETLAIKLNVVRQTVSKWEKGTSIPDADMLCRIADALDASAEELLGSPEREDKMDMTAIAKSLAEINEQLTVRNKRSNNVLKIVLGVAIGLFLLIAIVIVLDISTGISVIDNNMTVQKVDSEESSGTTIGLDENEIPLLQQAGKNNEHALQEFWRSRNISKEQIIDSWGNPVRENDDSASWLISEDKVITVFFTDSHYAYDCGIENR